MASSTNEPPIASGPNVPPSRRFTRRRLAWIIAGLLISLALVYAPVVRFQFVSFDDTDYVTRNPFVAGGLSPGNLLQALTRVHAGNWHPLTWISHQLDVTLFGHKPAGHHLTNVLLHALSAAALFLLLRSMTGFTWPSALVAAFFALHPLNVESVAWVAERKNVLSMLLWVACLGSYLAYRRRPGPRGYLAALLFFALAVMAKPMVVTLPFVLLLLDWWPLGLVGPRRAGRPHVALLLREKVPFFLLAAFSAGVTLFAQHQGRMVKSLQSFDLSSRLANALHGYLWYPLKMIRPTELAVLYPFSRDLPGLELSAAILFLALATAVSLLASRRRPWLATGWFWYLGTLFPVIGLVQIGEQSTADRYAYLPLIGLFLVVAVETRRLARGGPLPRSILVFVAAAALVILATASARQVRFWSDGTTLFERAVAVTGPNAIARVSLGAEYARAGRHLEAGEQFREARAIDPDNPMARYNLALWYLEERRMEEVMAEYGALRALSPELTSRLERFMTAWNKSASRRPAP